MEFPTKTELARDMVAGAVSAAVPFGWAAGDEVYGRSSKLRQALRGAGKGYVFAVPVNFKAALPSGAAGHRGVAGPADPRERVGDPLVRARLQGPPRLRLGLGRDLLAAALGADPPQPVRPF